MKNRHTLIALFICPFLIMGSCEDELVGQEPANSPVENFEYFWKTFDMHYGMFNLKRIDWRDVYNKYRPQITAQMSDEELYNVLCNMIVQLNDNHVNLYPTNGELSTFPGGVLSYRGGVLKILKAQEDYNIEICKKYVPDYRQETETIGFGTLDDQIGYVNIKGTDGIRQATDALTAALSNLSSTRGLIIDVRGFYGGFDAVSQTMAGFFATSDKLYMTTRKKSGPNQGDFTAPLEWYVSAGSQVTYRKPIVLLTSRFTQSAGETFTLALRQFDHVRTLGDTTAGSFSDNPNFELPNGWIFSVSVGDYRAPGNVSYEGTGIPPDIYFINSRETLLAEKDETLEKAAQMLR